MHEFITNVFLDEVDICFFQIDFNLTDITPIEGVSSQPLPRSKVPYERYRGFQNPTSSIGGQSALSSGVRTIILVVIYFLVTRLDHTILNRIYA